MILSFLALYSKGGHTFDIPTLAAASSPVRTLSHSTQLLMFQNQPGFIPTATDTNKSTFSPLQSKAAQIISSAKRITQFFDRDSRPDFAGANGMQSFLLNFLRAPSADPTQLQGKMQQFWDSLPPEK